MFLCVFLAFDFCRFCVVIRFFSYRPQRPMTSDFEGFSIPDFIHYIYFSILILEKEPVFPCLMFSAKQGNYLVKFIFIITSLVWRGPWLGIEPGTSRTRCQHSTTRLSRRRSHVSDWLKRIKMMCTCRTCLMLSISLCCLSSDSFNWSCAVCSSLYFNSNCHCKLWEDYISVS